MQSKNLMDNSTDAFADDAGNNKLANDVPLVVTKDLDNIALCPASQVARKDTKNSEGDNKDPYSVVFKKVPTDQEALVVDVTQQVSAQEVLHQSKGISEGISVCLEVSIHAFSCTMMSYVLGMRLAIIFLTM